MFYFLCTIMTYQALSMWDRLGMPKSRDFLLALFPGFSERIHPGIFWSRDKQKLMIPGFFALSFGISRDIPGLIFCSNGYILSLVKHKVFITKCKHNAMFQNISFRTPFLEHLFQSTCFRTHVSEHLHLNNYFRTPVTEEMFQNSYFKTFLSQLLSFFQNI